MGNKHPSSRPASASPSSPGSAGSPNKKAGKAGKAAKQGGRELHEESKGRPQRQDFWGAHEGGIACLAFASATSDRLVTGGNDGRVCLWDLGKRHAAAQHDGHTNGVTQVLWLPRKGAIISTSRDRSLRMWTREAPAGTKMEGHGAAVAACAASPDESTCMSGSRDGVVKLWDLSTCRAGEECTTSRNVVTSMRWIPRSATVLQASEDKMLRVWDTRTLRPSVTFPADQYFHTCCDATEDGLTFLTGSNGFGGQGCLVALWDVRTGRKLRDIPGHGECVTGCAFLDDGRMLTASRDSSVRLWHHDGSALATCAVAQPVTALALAAPASRVGAAALQDGAVTSLSVSGSSLEAKG